jgi:hypothetical protein
METINFYANKAKISRILAIVLLLFIVSLYGAYHHFNNTEYIHIKDPLLQYFFQNISVSTLWISSTIFFLLLSLFGLKNLLNKTPVLTLTNDELILPRSRIHINWKDIASIQIISIHGQEMLSIRLKNPQAFLRKLPFWRHMMYTWMEQRANTHFTVANLNVPLDHAYEIICNTGFKELVNEKNS